MKRGTLNEKVKALVNGAPLGTIQRLCFSTNCGVLPLVDFFFNKLVDRFHLLNLVGQKKEWHVSCTTCIKNKN